MVELSNGKLRTQGEVLTGHCHRYHCRCWRQLRNIDVCGIQQVSGLVPNLLSSTSKDFMCPLEDIEAIVVDSKEKTVPPCPTERRRSGSKVVLA